MVGAEDFTVENLLPFAGMGALSLNPDPDTASRPFDSGRNGFVGTGGAAGINESHFIGAAYGMERMMGRADTPVRRVLNYAAEHFTNDLPIVYVQTVVGRAANGDMVTRGLYIGDDAECFVCWE